MKFLREFSEGFLAAVFLLGALLAVLLLMGCANGVRMSDEETIACRTFGCVVYTEAELRDLVNRAGRAGYGQGWRDSNRQAGRDL